MSILHKVNFETKIIAWNKKGYFTMITELIHQEDIMISNMYIPNDKFEKYEAKLIDQKGQIHKSIV